MSNPDVGEEQSLLDFAFDVYNDAWDETVTGEDSHACRMEAVVRALENRLKAEGLREGEAKGIRDTVQAISAGMCLHWQDANKVRAAHEVGEYCLARADALSPQAKETK